MTSLILHPPRNPNPKPNAVGSQPAKGPRPGLTSATALVVGSIVGTGVFTMPAVLAGAAPWVSRFSRHRGRRDAARGPVRSAHQARAE